MRLRRRSRGFRNTEGVEKLEEALFCRYRLIIGGLRRGQGSFVNYRRL